MGKVRTVENKFISLLNEWTTSYLQDGKGLSPNTIVSYETSWGLMIDYMYSVKHVAAEKIRFEDFTFDTIMGYLDWLQKENKCKDSTRNVRLAAIRSFAKYAQNKDYKCASVFYVEAMKVPSKKEKDSDIRNAMTEEETSIIIKLPSPRDTYGYRDRAVMTMLYATGCRGQELCDLKVGDISFKEDGKASVKLTGKGSKTRRVRISEKAASILKSFLKRRGMSNQPDQFVFVTQRRCQMTVNCLEKIIAKYASIAKENHPDMFKHNVTPHVFRHSTATHMINHGVPLPVIQRFLGHEQISTTLKYAKFNQSSLDAALLDWDKKYWEEYLDEPYEDEVDGKEASDIEKNRAKAFRSMVAHQLCSRK